MPDVPDVQITLQMAGTRMGNCKQIPAVDCCPWARFWSVLACKLFISSLDAHVPQGQSLHGRGFPRVVGANEHDGIPQLDLDLAKAFEVADGELSEHPRSPLEVRFRNRYRKRIVCSSTNRSLFDLPAEVGTEREAQILL